MRLAAGARRCRGPTIGGLVWRSVLAAGLLVPAILSAQTVRGAVTRVGVPIPGVVVQLLDDKSEAVARAITDETGEYRLLAPRAGRYAIATRRVGFAPTRSPVFELRDGETRVEAVTMDGVAVRLDTVRVATAAGCLPLNARNSEVSAIWEQAKTALLATDVTLSQRAFSAALLDYRREVDLSGVSVLKALDLTEIDSVTAPWTSQSALILQKTGYVQVGADDTTSYLAPGLDVLTSAEFAGTNCFRVVEGSSDDVIGLSFEPAKPNKRLSELSGTLQLDRQSSELRSLEFTYTNLAPSIAKAGAGGRVEFARMRDGSWVIGRWQIRVPVVVNEAVVRRGAIVRQPTVVGTEVAGGDLFVARRGADTLWSRPLPTVAGVVTDSASGQTIAGARLRLREANRTVYSDSAGRFDFGATLPGQYTLLTNTPSLDSIGAISGLLLPVTEALSGLAVRVPNASRVLPVVCALPDDRIAALRQVGVLHGLVVRDSAVTDASPINVIVQWADSAAGVVRTERTETDDFGRYRFCDVPVGAPLELHAELPSLASAVVAVQLDTVAPFGRADLLLAPLSPDEGTLRGTVVDEIGAPIDNVIVELPQLGLRASTDYRGQYVIPRVATGRQVVSVRRLGFSPSDTTLTIEAGATLEQRYVLARVTILNEVNTTASREWARDFDEHRRLGLGQFLDRDELSRRESQRLGDLMSTMRGARMLRSGQSSTYLASNRTRSIGGVCYAHVWLDNNPMYLGRQGEPLYNLNELIVAQIEAIEYFPNPASTPAKYNNLNADCGVLVVHTRRD